MTLLPAMNVVYVSRFVYTLLAFPAELELNITRMHVVKTRCKNAQETNNQHFLNILIPSPACNCNTNEIGGRRRSVLSLILIVSSLKCLKWKESVMISWWRHQSVVYFLHVLRDMLAVTLLGLHLIWKTGIATAYTACANLYTLIFILVFIG